MPWFTVILADEFGREHRSSVIAKTSRGAAQVARRSLPAPDETIKTTKVQRTTSPKETIR